MKKFYYAALLPILFNLILSGNSFSQALYKVSLDEKVQQSPLIVEGKVVSQTCFWNSTHGMIFTSNKVEVYKVFKGTVSTQYIEVLTQGGTIGDESMWATDLLELQKDHIGVFFCWPNDINARSPLTNNLLWDVYSSEQGFFDYDLRNKSASAPFVRYSSVINELYPELQQKTGRGYEVKNASFNIGAVTPSPLSPTALAVTSFSPTSVNSGQLAVDANNLLTITGTDFGTATGSAAILFDDANNGTGGTAWTVSATSSLVVSWTNTQIQVRVPSRAGTGSFTVVDAVGTQAVSPGTLTVNFSILNLTFAAAPTERMFNLINQNGSGGYNYLYSNSTAGAGSVDFSTSAQKDPFERAITTWKEVCGLNYTYNGTTASQNIAVSSTNLENIIMLDNINTGVSRLASGVLASCYYGGSSCTGTLLARSPGFDILIRNSGVSTGSVNFNNGPCKTATASTEYDMESVLLHELGHSLGLGHINDSYIGPWPNVDPGKLMNYAIVNGVDRRNPDWSCYYGALYCINPRGLAYGACTAATDMVPLTPTIITNDDCPGTFPLVPTTTGTVVNFDLNHATSNKTVDPQYTAVTCASGTGITNNAFYALRTNSAGGILSISVSGYGTTPAAQSACTGAGVELALYLASSCPTAQAYPSPVACRTFNANGALTDISGLAANTNYLLMVDGISNTRANFNLTFSGAAVVVIPVRIASFTGVASTSSNNLNWKLENIISVDKIALEGSDNGTAFTELYTLPVLSNTTSLNGSFNDNQIAPLKYYRLKVYNRSGSIEYSNIVVLKRNGKYADIVISPNPVRGNVTVSFYKNISGNAIFKLLDINGKVVGQEDHDLVAGAQSLQLSLTKGLPAGTYILQVSEGGVMTNTARVIVK